VYRQIVEEHPGRVLAVYIRNVSHDANRIREIEELAAAVAAAGSGLVLAADSVAMAEHAAKLGLVPSNTVSDVTRERAAQDDMGLAGTQLVTRPTPDETAEAVAEGELQDLLSRNQDGSPPNVVVEPAQRDLPRNLEGK
jgi:hypothetical protein